MLNAPMSKRPMMMSITVGIVVLICLAACGLFLFLDPQSLDVRLVYGGF